MKHLITGIVLLEWWWLVAATGVRAAEAPAAGGLEAADRDGRVEAKSGGRTVFGWQREPLAQPKGGERFHASAFVHPLCTPSGFDVTAIQPADHLHHFGLWWPWKFVETGGAKFNTWEVQEGQGGTVARTAKVLESTPQRLRWELGNEVVVRAGGGEPKPVIAETATVTLMARPQLAAHALDIRLRQRPLGEPVTIVAYRYSGFSWRGPLAWNKDNSTMLTSEGHHRDNANGQAARWVLVSGPASQGTASVLLMSAAAKLAGEPERLRVWDSKSFAGNPFVNFNPVVAKAMPLDADHPAVAVRHYLVLAADRALDAKTAEETWREWSEKE